MNDNPIEGLDGAGNETVRGDGELVTIFELEKRDQRSPANEVPKHHALIGADAAQAHRQPGAERERQHGDRSSRDRHDSRRAGEIVHRLQG